MGTLDVYRSPENQCPSCLFSQASCNYCSRGIAKSLEIRNCSSPALSAASLMEYKSSKGRAERAITVQPLTSPQILWVGFSAFKRLVGTWGKGTKVGEKAVIIRLNTFETNLRGDAGRAAGEPV